MDPVQVLTVQHEAGAPAGWLGEAMQGLGCQLTVATPYDGSQVPALAGFDGLLVLGGAVDSWDDTAAPWLPATRALVRRAEAEVVPTLGICLGHQIASQALGGSPGRNPAGRALGIEPVGWLPAVEHDPIFADVGSAGRALHWNRDIVLALPEGATVLATSQDGAVQVARLGESTWGIQSHPEVDADIVAGWCRDEESLRDRAARARMREVVEDMHTHDRSLREAWLPLARAFVRLVRGGAVR